MFIFFTATFWNTSARNVGSHTSNVSVRGWQASTGSAHTDPPLTVPQSTLSLDDGSSPEVSACTLSSCLSRLCLSPEEAAATIKYRLPSRSPQFQDAILDPVVSVAFPLDCPTAVHQDFLDVPSHLPIDTIIGDPASDATISKKASNILQKRHRKMKRHQYKKWRKRNKFRLRIQKQRRRKKKRERWERHLNIFRFNELSACEGEKHLAKKQESLDIYLRYLGVQVDDSGKETEEVIDEQGKKKKKGPTKVMSPGSTGRLVPKPILPEGVAQRWCCMHQFVKWDLCREIDDISGTLDERSKKLTCGEN